MPCTAAPGGVLAEHRYTPGSGVAHGCSDSVGRFTNCTKPEWPPAMSPPMMFGSCCCMATVSCTARARMTSLKPGANRSIWSSIAVVMSTVEPLGTWQ